MNAQSYRWGDTSMRIVTHVLWNTRRNNLPNVRRTIFKFVINQMMKEKEICSIEIAIWIV